MHFAEKLDRFISNAGNTFSRSEAKKIQASQSRGAFYFPEVNLTPCPAQIQHRALQKRTSEIIAKGGGLSVGGFLGSEARFYR